MSMFAQRPSEVRKSVIECIEVGLVPFVRSSPGLGKSSIFRQIAEDFNLEFIDIRLSQAVPEDMMGLPMRGDNGKAHFMPFDMFPTQNDKIPAGKNGWLIALDEFNSGTKAIQAAAYKLVLDRYAGMHKLHDNVFMVCAGNLETDRAIVNPLGTAMKSRLIHIMMQADLPDFMNHAVPAGFDHRVLGFLEFQPSKLHHFVPDSDDNTFPCSRTWEFASKLIKDKATDDINLPLLAGALGDGTAVEFHTFLSEYDKIPSYATVLNNVDTTPIPANPSTKFALITMLLDRYKKDDFEEICKFIRRLPSEFQIIYFRGVRAREPEIRRTKVFIDNTLHLVKFLNDTSDEMQAA